MAQQACVEAFCIAWPAQQERRAREFEAARHRPGVDFPGAACVEELRDRWIRLTEIARAHRARGQLPALDVVLPDIENVLGEFEAAS